MRIIFQLTPVQSPVGASPGSSKHKVGIQPGQHTFPHTPTHTATIETSMHLTCTSGMWEQTQADMGRMCKPHRQWPRRGIDFILFVRSNKTTLFKDLLYNTSRIQTWQNWPISTKQCSMTFYWTQYAFLWTRLACILSFPQFTSL